MVKAATAIQAGELARLRRHRAELVRRRSAEQAADRRLKRLWSLAAMAHERLHA